MKFPQEHLCSIIYELLLCSVLVCMKGETMPNVARNQLKHSRFKLQHIFQRKKYLILVRYLSVGAFGLALFPVPLDYRWGIASAVVTSALGVFWLYCVGKVVMLFEKKMRVVLSVVFLLYLGWTMLLVFRVERMGSENCQKGKVIVPAKTKAVPKKSYPLQNNSQIIEIDDVTFDDACLGVGHGNFFALGIGSYWYNSQHQLILKDTPVTTIHNFLSMVPFAWVWLIVLLDPTSFKLLFGLIQY